VKNGEECFRRFLEGDGSGFEDVVDLYRDYLIYFINRYVHDMGAAEDLAADMFAVLYVDKNRYHFKVSLKTYLFAIGKHRAINYLKKSARAVPMDTEGLEAAAGDAGGGGGSPEDGSPEEIYIKDERDKQIDAALEKLHEEYRAVLHLLYFEGLTYEEAARVLGKSKKQIDNLAYRAKRALKAMLERDGFTYEIQG